MLAKIQKELNRINKETHKCYSVVIRPKYISVGCNGVIGKTFDTLQGAYCWLTFIKEDK